MDKYGSGVFTSGPGGERGAVMALDSLDDLDRRIVVCNMTAVRVGAQ
jgi:hypothetical protein